MKQPAKTLIFTMVSMALIACETPKKTESVVILDPVPKEQIKKTSQPSVKAKPDQESETNALVFYARPGKTKNLLKEQDALVRQPGGLQAMPQSILASRITAEKKERHKHLAPNKIARYQAYSQTSVPMNVRIAIEPKDRENYAHLNDNPVKRVTEQPVSTFSIDVDTGSYTNIRRMLREGRLPVHDAVRVEEMINYFSYQYPVPRSKETPFSVTTEMAPSPWAANRHLLRIGIKGYEVPKRELKAANLVFLIDVSGSMRSKNKLGLLKKSLTMLTHQLSARDHVSMVVYAGASGVVLEPTAGNEKAVIINALERLQAGGSTNGGAGIRLAYRMAEQSFVEGGINRILLATVGFFNVGTTIFESLKSLVEEKRKSGVTLTTLGFGAGNYNDHLAEQLADHGNGANYYIDSLQESQKVLVDQMSSTMQTIAGDTKIQIEFNPSAVSEYRLIGYENRALKREDFNNDKVDAGDIGAGHTVTALYEITLASHKGQIDPLRYGTSLSKRTLEASSDARELAFLRLRYKKPGNSQSTLIEQPLYVGDIQSSLVSTSADFRFAASVAGFGQLLKGGTYTKSFTYMDVLKLARNSRGSDPFGYRSEFVQLVNLASSLNPGNAKKIRE
jgi:Ca-activated chloride channel family protein